MSSVVKYFLIISVSIVGLSSCSSSNDSKFLEKNKSKDNKRISISPKNSGRAILTKVAKKPNKLEKVSVTAIRKKVTDKQGIIGKPNFQYARLTPQAKQCMQEYYVDYEYALCLYNYGDMSSAVDYLKSYNANNQSIEANDLLQKIDQPLVYIVDNANQKLDKWLNRGTELGAFILTPPALLKNKSTIVSLVKAEFETKKSFNQRVALAQQEAVDKDDMAEKKYQRQLATYNQALNDYSVKIKQEVQKKEQDSLDTYLDFVIQNIANVLGTPYLVNAIYDADKQQMFAELLSNKSNFHRSVVVDVPLEDAKDFKINTAKVLPTLEFDTTRKSLSVVGVSMELGGKLYQAKFLNNNNYATSLRNSVDAVDIISKY